MLRTPPSHLAAFSPRISVIALSSFSSEEGWCIDYRAVLTLSVCKETYERLGLVGAKISSSGDHHGT
jgi:hypothetical protein